MKKTLMAVTLLAAGASQASGLAIDTQSGRATGMGSTGVASAKDSSAIFYNPAGILGVNKLDAQLGDALILVNLGFTPEGGAEQSQNTVSPPPHAYFVYKFTEQLGAGVGVFTPFGANSRWPDDFVGRQIAIASSVTTFDINPTLGFAPVKWLRIGAGAQIVYGMVEVERRLVFGAGIPEGSLQLTTDTWGFGFNAGVQADLVPGMLTLGATYRSRVGMDTEGDADFEGVPPGLPAPIAASLVDQPVTLDVTMPATVGLGLAFSPTPRLTLAFDANWVEWSTIQELLFQFQTVPALSEPAPKRWSDRWNFHVGGEFKATDALALRLGFIYDPTPTPEETLTPDLPDADRLNFSAGLGYALSNFRADLGYQFVLLQDQRSTAEELPGTYSGSAHVIGLTLGYSQ
ncbi:transporter [Archangium violaceum]|uniref:OmpP1/FadL family transporter n=1 Tax=Archangium violaceum TaxID=83451 RepID=UPI002B2B7887|nr:transporter [Archangium violaceum]